MCILQQNSTISVPRTGKLRFAIYIVTGDQTEQKIASRGRALPCQRRAAGVMMSGDEVLQPESLSNKE